MKPDLLSLIIVGANLLAYALMWLDKQTARKQGWRVPESTFFALAFAGGWPLLLLAMRQFRHKTIKRSFQWRLMGVIVLQAVALLAYWLQTA